MRGGQWSRQRVRGSVEAEVFVIKEDGINVILGFSLQASLGIFFNNGQFIYMVLVTTDSDMPVVIENNIDHGHIIARIH